MWGELRCIGHLLSFALGVFETNRTLTSEILVNKIQKEIDAF